jgi:hypothetical protein
VRFAYYYIISKRKRREEEEMAYSTIGVVVEKAETISFL